MGYPTQGRDGTGTNFDDLSSLQGEANSVKDEAQEVTDQVLRRQVPWDTYQKADLISDRELQLIKRYDKQERALQQKLLVEEEGVLYVQAFFSLLRSIASEEVVQYVLALVEDMIKEGGSAIVDLLQRATTGQGSGDTCAILLRMLQRPDWFTREKAAFVLSSLLSSSQPSLSASEASSSTGAGAASSSLRTFVEWLCNELRTPSNDRSEQATITCLSMLLRSTETREIFLRCNGVSCLSVHLAPTHHLQTLYEACLCSWLLSFNHSAVVEMVHLNVPKRLSEVVRQANKEKVLRVATMCLENTLKTLKDKDKDKYAKLVAKLLETGLSKAIATQRLNSYTDEELLSSMDWLEEKLAEGKKIEISSFDKYADEVLSGTLDWTMLRKEQKFWKMNAGHFVEKDCVILKALARILESSTDERSLEVACHDLGQFVTHFPHGRGYLRGIKVKPLVMKLMVHPDPDVQKQALMCTQKLMLSKDSLDLLSLSALN